VYFHAAFRLLNCFETHTDLVKKQGDAEAEIRPQASQQVIYRPNLVGLNKLTEQFLYEGKNFIRDISGIFMPFDGPMLHEAMTLGDKASKWAEATFGHDDRLTNHLRKNWPWLHHLIKMRNATEHPGGYSGTLHVHNYRIIDNAVHR